MTYWQLYEYKLACNNIIIINPAHMIILNKGRENVFIKHCIILWMTHSPIFNIMPPTRKSGF